MAGACPQEGMAVSEIGRTTSSLTPVEEVTRREWEAAVKDGWREMLTRYDWDSFATLTASLWTPEGLLRAFKQYARHLASVAQGKVRYFVVVEVGPSGTPHLHALLAGTASLTNEVLEKKWRPGLARVERFDERRGAAAYITKDIMRNADDWAFSEKMPRLRFRMSDTPDAGGEGSRRSG